MTALTAGHAPSAVMLFPRPQQAGMKRAMETRSAKAGTGESSRLVELLAGVSTGDRGAFSELYQSTSAKLYGICIRLLGNEAEAQDALQDVFMTVWRKAELFDPAKAGAVTWLSVIARNKAVDRVRRRALPADDLAAAADISDERPSSFEVVESAQDAARLNICLDELEERARSMIRAAFLDGASYPELAQRQGVPLGTMKSWIRRGLQQLRGCLDG